MSEMNKVNEKDLNNVAGGCQDEGGYMSTATPCVDSGYLALRSEPWDDDSNVICQIWPGARFFVDPNNTAFGSGYTYYYANYDGSCGWVNASFVTILD